jgi:hypothetical protein
MSTTTEEDGAAGEPPVQPATGKGTTVAVTSLEAYEALTATFGTDISFSKLIQLAEAAKSVSEVVAPTCDEARTTSSLYRWFQQNWAAIAPTLDSIELEDSHEEEEEEEKGVEDEKYTFSSFRGIVVTPSGLFRVALVRSPVRLFGAREIENSIWKHMRSGAPLSWADSCQSIA